MYCLSYYMLCLLCLITLWLVCPALRDLREIAESAAAVLLLKATPQEIRPEGS